MSDLHPNTVTQFFSPRQRLLFTWREAADHVWSTWQEYRQAPRSTRAGAFEQHLHALEMEHRAAMSLAAHPDSPSLAAHGDVRRFAA